MGSQGPFTLPPPPPPRPPPRPEGVASEGLRDDRGSSEVCFGPGDGGWRSFSLLLSMRNVSLVIIKSRLSLN